MERLHERLVGAPTGFRSGLSTLLRSPYLIEILKPLFSD